MKTGKHATVIGTVTDDILQRTVTVAVGQNRQDRDFKNVHCTVADLIEFLGTFETGQKDGRCILQGELVGGQRIAKNVRANHLLIIDIDTGMTVDEVGRILVDKGLFGVIWTTHSFGKDTTEIAEEHFFRWCKKNGRPIPTNEGDVYDALRRYLFEEKKYRQSVVFKFAYLGRHLVEGGMKYVVRHAAMPKLRVMFLLHEPFDFTAGSSQKARIEEWKKAYVNVSAWLGVAYDSSCVDPSRLMYTPRVPEGAQIAADAHEILVFGGEPLDVSMIRETAFGVMGNLTRVLEDEGVVGDTAERTTTFKTRGLRAFAKKCPDFDIVGFMEATAPDDRRSQGDGDKSEWACPNEDSHTSMRADDRAFMVSTNGEYWYAGCMHDGCKQASGEDRLWYLDMLCAKYGIEDARELEAWSASAQQEQVAAGESVAKAAAGDYNTLIDALHEGSQSTQVTEVMKALAAVTDEIEIDRCLNLIRKKTKGMISLPRLRATLKGFAAAHNAAVGVDDKPAEDPREPEPEDPTKAKEVWDHWSFDKRFYAVRAILQRANENDPRLFKSRDGRLLYVMSTENGAKTVDAELNTVTWHTIGRVRYKHLDRLTGEITEDRVPKDLIDTLLGDLEPKWPLLNRISNVPIVLKDGTQAVERGYIPAINTYLDPPGEFAELPHVITPDELAKACDTLLECVRDFPFCDYNEANASLPIMSNDLDEDGHPWPNMDRGRSSRAHAIAMIIEPFARHLIGGACPMYFIDKPAPGTGAGYLADVAFFAAQGTRAVAQMMSDNNEEFRKAITATLRDGAPIVFVDNVNRKVDSGPLAAAITNGTWQDRILGESNVTKIKIENTWLIAGNNVSFTPENMRRLVPIKLDARVPNPAFDRPKTAFKHNPLQDYLAANRTSIIRAINVLIKNWVDQGMKPSNLTFNSFEHYAATMGGILEAAGIAGFLDSLPEFNSVKNVDDDSKNDYGVKMFERYGFSHFSKMDAYLALKGVGFGDVVELPVKTDKDDNATATNLRNWMVNQMDGNVFYLDPEKTKLITLHIHRSKKDRTGWRFRPVKGFDDVVLPDDPT